MATPRMHRPASLLLLAAALAAPPGCIVDGRSVRAERIAYGDVILRSWKDQFLLNTVRIRYMDPPMLLDVASVIHQHAVEGESNASATFDPGKWSGLTGTLGGSSRFEDRPTFTYAPVRGEQFTRTMLTPVQPAVLAFLLQSGWPADILMRTYVQRINGLHNRMGAGRRARPADPGFERLVDLLHGFQMEGRLTLQVVRGAGDAKTESVVFILPGDDSDPAREARKLLGLADDAKEYTFRYGVAPANDRDIAVLTRSMVEVMVEFAACVDVPPEDVTEGRAAAALGGEQRAGPVLRIRCADDEPPPDAYASAEYHGRWYYVDDRDFGSKTLFTISLLLLSLAETGGTAVAPVVTISTN